MGKLLVIFPDLSHKTSGEPEDEKEQSASLLHAVDA
jgi:hypothetical protein